MKTRRILAAVLCAAMIFTSESFTMSTFAAENTGDVVIETVDENAPAATKTPVADEDAIVTEMPEETEEPKATEVPAEVPVATDEPIEELPEETEEPVATQTPEETEVPTETPVATDEPEVLPTEEPMLSASPSMDPTQTPEETVEVSPSPEAEVVEVTSPTPSVTPEGVEAEGFREVDFERASADVLGVDENGNLERIGDGSLPSTVIIPDEAKHIPASSDLFKNNGTVVTVKFNETSQLESIAAEAFSGSVVETITIPAGVTVIEEETFKNSALTSITIKGAVESIGKEAFMNTKLKSFVAPAALKTIGESAFASCSSLSMVTMNNLEEIGARAFQNCTKLYDGGIGWSKKLKTIGDYAFAGCSFEQLSMATVNSDGSIEEVTIGVGAFSDCASLTNITFPQNVKVMSNSVLKGCKKLTEVSLPDELATISSFAFSGCSSLAKIDIPENVIKIEAKAFESCVGLKEIIINNKNTESDEFFIAEDAFPAKTGVTMKGYDGKVQDYAEKMAYTYESLHTKYSFTNGFDGHAELSAVAVGGSLSVADKALWTVPGTELLITVKPNEGYVLREGTLKAAGTKDIYPELVSCSEEAQVFRFIMPEYNVVIKAEFDESNKAVAGDLTFIFDAVNDQPVFYDDVNNEVTFDKAGQQTQLSVSATKKVGAWLLNYSSSNKNVAVISNTGLITAKGAGSTTIKASLKSDSSKYISFTVKVTNDSEITDISLEFSNLDRARTKTEVIDGKEYTIIEYNKSTLAAGNKEFKVNLIAEDAEGYELMVDSEWSTIDKNIAALGSGKSSTNSNEIIVKKGSEGETIITVTVPHKDEEVEPCTESFIVRVVDATPRLAEEKVTINTLSEVGTAIDIVPVYQYEINHEVELTLCQKVIKSGVVSYVPFSGLRVDYDEALNEHRLVSTGELKIAEKKNNTYKDDTKLYIKGEFDEVGGTFYIPINTTIIENKPLNPTIKLSGKINLFFNHTASMEEQGSVKITQNLTNETVKKMELVSEENHKKPESQKPDAFANNFEVVQNAEGEWLIVRTANEMMQVNGKDVIKGYLYVYYDGYNDNEPIKKAITVSTHNTTPKYELSMTKETVSVLNKDAAFELQLLDKSVKGKPAISLANLDPEDGLGFDYLSGTTDDLFKDLSIDDAVADDTITLQVDGTPRKGKAVINVKMSTWSKYLKFTFNLSTTGNMPTAKLSASTITLNNNCLSQEGVITVNLNQKDAYVADFTEAVYAGNAKYAAEAAKLSVTTEGNVIKVKMNDAVAKGSYKFSIAPSIQYDGEDKSYVLKNMNFTVKVTDTMPSIKLKSGTLTVNSLYSGLEEVSTTYTINNLPAGSSYIVDDADVDWVYTSTKNAAIANMIADGLEWSFEGGKLTISLAEGTYPTNFSFAYNIKGLKLLVGDAQDEITLKDFKVTVKGVAKDPTVSVKAKGTLNPIDADSSIVYTGTVKNIVSGIENVSIREYNENGSYYVDENNETYSPNFILEASQDNPNVVELKANPNVTLDAKKTYKIKLVYQLEACPDLSLVTGVLSIKPKQTLPKIKTDKSSAYLYAGQNRPKTVDVEIVKVDSKGKETEAGGEIIDVTFKENTSKTIQKAFKVAYDENTGMMTLELVNPALLVLNKDYTIEFETKYLNQMENTTGNVFKLKVKVSK